ncbi:tigger transposable element-derived protein 4-like [Lytechinus variegatus]|uniref:tigger transposable element-derived protein 4-like n=1 Tax=Lytechinus variegatus TaxID=7654 RepID=UPI001BB10B65|nr:tigger transposable element-derived protein 4-like [Lytechinus variegatus]
MAPNTQSYGGRNPLYLEKKMEFTKMYEMQKYRARSIAEKLSIQGHRCGKTWIVNIIKRKREWIEYESNMPLDRKRKLRKTANDELNAILYEWFKDSTTRLLPVSGSLLQEKARQIAVELQLEDFKASNGWLEALRRRHNIVFGKMIGESGGVETAAVDDWKQRLPKLCDDCSGGKRSKECITLMLCANALGEKEQPMIIGKAIKPRCFGRLERKDLPVDYHANKKAWMTSNLFELYMKKLNKKMQRQRRKIIMLLDNAPCHPYLQLSNIKLVFLPPNTTSITQPMDQGIIQAVKLKFRKRQLRGIINRMEREPGLTAPELMKKTDVLQAIQWIDKSWRDTTDETIQKCFRNCGIGTQNLEAEKEVESSEVSGDGLDAVCQREFQVSLEELAEIDVGLLTTDPEQASTIEDFQRRLESNGDDSDENDDDDEPQASQPDPELRNLLEVSSRLAKIRAFAVAKGFKDIPQKCSDLQDSVESEHLRQKQVARQTTMFDFFKKT